MRPRLLLLTASLLPSGLSWAADGATLGEIVVTAPMMSDPFTVETDPKAPRQPIPAADGASYLENIPGFSVSRKGGTDGDAALRGLGGSRLNILLDDSFILGGCGQRMDPPTAYVYPESYDKVVVLKGPQSVRYGAAVAGTVRFERETERFVEPGVRGNGSLVLGSFGRNDQMFDVTAGNPTGFGRLIGTRSDSDDYEDGDGNEVHSRYTRWSGTAIAGWTPDDDTRVEFTYEVSDGEAAYADRTMDGAAFEREGYSASFERSGISDTVEHLEAKVYRNYIDHVMDNFSLREVQKTTVTMGGMTAPGYRKSVMNPDRDTAGARVELQLGLGEATFANVGADYQQNAHSFRMAMAMTMDMMGNPATIPPDPDVDTVARNDKASFSSKGLFGELTHSLSLDDTLVAGLRVDRSEAEAEQATMPMGTDDGLYGGVAAGTRAEDTNLSGFVRLERALDATTLYAALGRAERSPDFWERDRVFGLDTEKTTQLDLGLAYRRAALEANVALFYADIADYVLITNSGASARNVDATTIGGEAELAYALTPHWTARGALAYVHGENDSDNVALAQMPPLEGTLGIDYKDAVYSMGAQVRMAARQDRIDVGSGTIYGIDISETPGFAVLSVNGGYRPNDAVLLTAGIDNLLDRTYSEHLGKGSADLGAVVGRVNEPGRTYWVKASATF